MRLVETPVLQIELEEVGRRDGRSLPPVTRLARRTARHVEPVGHFPHREAPNEVAQAIDRHLRAAARS